jgi:hypothetical protein
LNIASDVMLDGQQHHVAAIGPAFGNGPLHLDHAADAPEMLDQPDAFVVRGMNDQDPEAAKIAKDLDRHRLLPRSEPQWLTV